MKSFAEFVHFLGFSVGIVSLFLIISYKRRTDFGALSSYMRFILFVNLVIFLSHFIGSIVSSIWTHEEEEQLLIRFYPYLVVIYGGIRILASVAILEFSFRTVEMTFPRKNNYAAFVFFFLVSFILIYGNSKIADSFMLSKLCILSFHLFVLFSLIIGYLKLKRFSSRIKIFYPNKIQVLYMICLLYGFMEVILRVFYLFGEEKHEAYIILGIGSILFVFNLLNSVYFKKALKLPHLIVSLPSENLIKKFGITSREEEIINLICKGKTNKEIAEILFISPVTVRDHTSNIYRKTGVRSRTELAGLFIERPTG